MKRVFIVISIFLFVSFVAKSQTATDFTATDCDGITNNLFTELNNGKIVVLVWVEPCVGCISDAKAAYDAMMSINATNPGKVKFWLIDDIGDTPCSQLATWATNSNIITENIQLFSNAGNAINEMNYGGLGMPHVVVVGNSTHHIYLNLLNGANDGGAITAAINQAITNRVGELAHVGLTVFPNPASENVLVECILSQPEIVHFSLFDVLGKCIKSISFEETHLGKNRFVIPLGNEISTGNYFLKSNIPHEKTVITITINNAQNQ